MAVSFVYAVPLALPLQPVYAAYGLAFSQETVFAPLGKQRERFDNTGKRIIAFGRETTEFMGLAGFSDLSPNWRLLYGLQTALAGYPLFKFSGSLAFMINTPYNLPMRPYLFLGLDPLVSANPDLMPFGLGSHGGFGVEYSWNNSLHLNLEVRSYFNSPYQAKETTEIALWPGGTFSLGGQAGFFF
ncbi:MAG: hypothetical protein IV090_18025 [Candidatus Sericytochromatia bacterium]|nr:hypothetical protein [Candidatus Sericytochromatia bacterium]